MQKDLECPVAVDSVEEMLEHLEKHQKPNVILMDIQLPGMSGIKGMEIIKSKYPEIEIIMLTVYHDSHKIFDSLKAGASGYLLNENGKFDKFIPFDKDFQLAPITSFLELQLKNENQLVVGGNSFRVNTYHGAYSALKGLLVKGKDRYNFVSEFGIEPFHDQIKKIESLKMKSFNLLIVVSNDGALRCYSY
jgi:CheY-like chemotaxis protein